MPETDPEALARIHAAAFDRDRPWTAAEFGALLASPHATLFTRPGGFALTRLIAGEAELLTLAVAPTHQRQGIANALMRDWLAALTAPAPAHACGECPAPPAERAFLEVAADNTAARALYARHGFAEVAQRTGYYRRTPGPDVDALILAHILPRGQG